MNTAASNLRQSIILMFCMLTYKCCRGIDYHLYAEESIMRGLLNRRGSEDMQQVLPEVYLLSRDSATDDYVSSSASESASGYKKRG